MGRFHTNWLNMMYPRLRLAANLLRDDGVIFISIDDGEVTNIRRICDEVFGEENFVAQFIWHSRQNKDNRNITGVSVDHEYIICYSKQFGQRVFYGTERKTEQYTNPDNDPRGPWTSANMVGLATADARPNLHYDLINPSNGINYGCPAKGWRYDRNTMKKLIEDGRVLWPDSPDGRPRKKSFLAEISDNLPGYSSVLPDGVYTNTATKEIVSLLNGHWFDFPKPTAILKELIAQTTNGDDIILDFFSGSATTAHAVMQLNAEDGGNRRFIMVQLPEVCDDNSEAFKAGYRTICEIGKERIRRAGNEILEKGVKKWLVKDYEETDTGAKMTVNLNDLEKPDRSFDAGFRVFKLDSSNLKIWDNAPIPNGDLLELENRLMGMLDCVKTGRTDLDVVYEVMLKLGQDMCETIVPIDLSDGRIVYGVGADVTFIVCLAQHITPEDAEAMAEYAPGRIVFSDRCFDNATEKSNVKLTLRDRGVTIKVL